MCHLRLFCTLKYPSACAVTYTIRHISNFLFVLVDAFFRRFRGGDIRFNVVSVICVPLLCFLKVDKNKLALGGRLCTFFFRVFVVGLSLCWEGALRSVAAWSSFRGERFVVIQVRVSFQGDNQWWK